MRCRKFLFPATFIFIISFLACNSTGKKEVIFKEATINSLTDLIDHIRAVRLEHGDSILIGRNPILFQKDSSFYLVDKNGQKKIFRFALDGRFLNTIGEPGNGPGEYVNIKDVIIDEQEDDVFILSSYTYIYRYSKEGYFKERLVKPHLQIQAFTKQDSCFWIHSLTANYDTIFLLRTNLQLDILDSLIFPLCKTIDNSMHRVASFLFHFKPLGGKVNFSVPPYPQIYEIENNAIREKLSFYFAPQQYATVENLETSNMSDLIDYKLLQYLVNFYENKDYILVDFQCGGRDLEGHLIQAIQNKSSGEWNWWDIPISKNTSHNPHWYLGRIGGMSKDGALMGYIPAPQPMEAFQIVKHLIINPELFTSVNEEMDMFIFLCYLKHPGD